MRRQQIKKISITLMIGITLIFSGYSQTPYKGEAQVLFGEDKQSRETVILQAIIDLTDLKVETQNKVIFTPTFRSLDGSQEIQFEPFIITGKKRLKSMRRKKYYNSQYVDNELFDNVIQQGYLNQRISFQTSLPYQQWMLNSKLVVIEQSYRCGKNLHLYSDSKNYKLYEGPPYVFPEPYKPTFVIAYLQAPIGEPKILRETYSAQLNFMVNKTELVPSYGNNASILIEVDEIMKRMEKDSLLTIQKVVVHGYASPEGNVANNQRLSEGRAQAFVKYLYEQHNFYQNNRLIVAEGVGEDWPGLRKAVEQKSYFDNKERVLEILDNIYEPERRKNLLKSLSGGRTYRMLLEEVYPSLRRNEYTIEYEVRGFNQQEALQIFHTRPRLLDLNELFMVASLYESHTEEYKEVFDVAARLFPESPIAQLNAAAMEIENSLYDTAIKRLERMDTPEALINLGIAWWYKGEYEKSYEYLNRAAESGDKEALENREEFTKWLEAREDW